MYAEWRSRSGRGMWRSMCTKARATPCRSSLVAEVRQKGATRCGTSVSMADLGSSLRESSTPFAMREKPDLRGGAEPLLERARKGTDSAAASMLLRAFDAAARTAHAGSSRCLMHSGASCSSVSPPHRFSALRTSGAMHCIVATRSSGGAPRSPTMCFKFLRISCCTAGATPPEPSSALPSAWREGARSGSSEARMVFVRRVMVSAHSETICAPCASESSPST
mmetsp:Transcript_40973/g.101858  ORF Transcript_40973/g.101858 Transcript_40973/m.101858 type:complete len:223 (-) Transcript_40973:334-1002(-)